ncbi:WD40 repeat-like protein, partial [Atractiella rhizophila]
IFATATTDGWVIYGTWPLRILGRREFSNSSLRIVLPLHHTNLLFLVGGPPSPLFPPNKVVLWDDAKGKAIFELEFREEVLGLAARNDRLAVVLRRRVVLYALGKGEEGVWREGSYETTDNPKGLIAMASSSNATLLAFPGRQQGQLQIIRLPQLARRPPQPPPPSYDTDPRAPPFPSIAVIVAHETALAAITCTPSGSLIATASSKGTLIRIWDPETSSLIRELRRGTDEAEIFSIRFRPDGCAICVSSDKGTVHVWELGDTKSLRRGRKESSTDPTKPLNLLKPYLPKYFSSEWSHSQFRLPPPTSSQQASSPVATAGHRATTTVEDDICLCAWISVKRELGVDDPSMFRKPPTRGHRATSSASSSKRQSLEMKRFPMERKRTDSGSSRKGKMKEALHTYSQSQSHSRPSSSATTPSERGDDPTSFYQDQIIALTHSGGWYRISIDEA